VRAKITVPDIRGAKRTRRLTMVTAYDCTFAQLIDRARVDILLVGDSLGMVVQGEHFTASIVGFLPEPQRGDAAKSPDFPTEPALPPHFIVPAR